jgi:phosphatidylglycerol---prolipoprotein diacylglyceryl transferase
MARRYALSLVKPVPVSFHIGPLQVHTYGIGLALTFLFGLVYFERRLRKNGYPTEWFTGVFIWIVVSAVIGARLVHVLANWSTYSAHPSQILAIWNGGLSSFGGLLFAVPVGIILSRRRCPELPTVRELDLVAPVLVSAWGIGRLLGPQLMVAGGGAQTSAWFGLSYAGQVGKRVPVPIFQAIDCFVIFGILLLIEHYLRDRPDGFIISAAVALWGLSRFVEEHFWLGLGAQRGSTQSESHAGPVLVQGAGLIMCAAGALAMALLWRQHRRRSASARADGPPADGSNGESRPGPDSVGSSPGRSNSAG